MTGRPVYNNSLRRKFMNSFSKRFTASGFWFWLVLAFISIYFLYPIRQKIKFGIDLVGGTYITLRVQTDKEVERVVAAVSDKNLVMSFNNKKENEIKKGAVTGDIEVLRTRLNTIGAEEIKVAPQGETDIIIELPDVPSGMQILPFSEVDKKLYVLVPDYAEISGRHLKDAKAAIGGQYGTEAVVAFKLTSSGAKIGRA